MKAFLLLSICVSPIFATLNGCLLPIGEYYSPLLLYGTIQTEFNSGSVIMPSSNGFLVDNGQHIILVCPDRYNFLRDQGNSSRVLGSFAQFVCTDEEILLNGKTPLNPNHLKCAKPIRGQLSVTNQQCAHQQGKIYNIGYNIGTNYLKVFEVCYERNTGNSFYAKHLINGKFIKYSPKAVRRPNYFDRDGVDNNIPIVDSYTIKNQERIFSTLLDSSAYIDENFYLARGHLSPDADFVQVPLKWSTYFYLNTSPQWQNINQGNWIRVENFVRKAAELLNEDLEIYTGNFEVLELPNRNNNHPTPMYLAQGKKVAVPKYVWKIAYHPQSKKAVVIIVLNNPFAGPISPFCSDVCTQYNWNCPTWRNYTKGYVFCCKYLEFQEIVRIAPQLEVNGVLDNNGRNTCPV